MRLKKFVSRWQKVSPGSWKPQRIRWEKPPIDAVPEERERIEIQNYLDQTRRVAFQRDLLVDLRYGSSEYQTLLREVEHSEQELSERRLGLARLYPGRRELQKPSAWERRQAIIAHENRLFTAAICIAGLLIACAGVFGFLYDQIQPYRGFGHPFICLGFVASGLLLSALTSKQAMGAAGARLKKYKGAPKNFSP